MTPRGGKRIRMQRGGQNGAIAVGAVPVAFPAQNVLLTGPLRIGKDRASKGSTLNSPAESGLFNALEAYKHV